MLMAVNSAGQDTASIVLKVDGQVDDSTRYTQFNRSNSHFYSSATAPKFTRRPIEQHCREGQEAVFECEFESTPNQIDWFRDDEHLQPTPNVKINFPTKNTTKLTLLNVGTESAGEYLCVLRNQFGEDLASALLRVEKGEQFVGF